MTASPLRRWRGLLLNGHHEGGSVRPDGRAQGHVDLELHNRGGAVAVLSKSMECPAATHKVNRAAPAGPRKRRVRGQVVRYGRGSERQDVRNRNSGAPA